MENLTILVTDKNMRSILIKAAMRIETLLNAGKITAMTPVKTPLTPEQGWGLRVDFTWTRNDAGVLLVTAHYMLDTLAFKKWVTEDMKKVSGQHLMFMDMGLVVAIRDGKWDKADFMFVNGSHDDVGLNSTWIPLNLLSHESIFRVHRDLGCLEDWVVYYDEPIPQDAARTASA